MTRARRPPAKREHSAAPAPAETSAAASEHEPPRRSTLLADLAMMLGAFIVATVVVAELAGAPNLGTSLSFGQIAFALAALYVLVRR